MVVAARLIEQPIEQELKESYLTYAMSVIVSRALPDVRDGLKPSQRRILVAMQDLGLTPTAATSKCAGIVGETMKRYHPHGDQAIYPTLVRMGQEWNTRYPLVDKQGNFGSIAGLPAAAMRYTEARLSPIAALMLEDLDKDTVDFVPTYDEKGQEPVVLPSKFPNLLANGSQGIAVGMATSIPPHNLAEICDAIIRVIDDPEVTVDELLEICPGPDFPTGGIICGREGIRQGYYTGRGTIVVRARARIEEVHGGRFRIIISEIPYQQVRDRIEEKIHEVAAEGKIPGIAAIRNESDLEEPVRLVIDLKREADPEIVLNQLYEYTPLQDTFSLIFLALVDGKPRILSFKALIEEYIRHRETVIRRRTQYLLQKARQRTHTVEGLLIALANLDEVIQTIRTSATQAEAKQRLMGIACPAAMLRRALGEEGFLLFQKERGQADTYSLTPVQADAILRMTLGQLVNLEQERLAEEHRNLLADIAEYLRILSDRRNILEIIRQDCQELKRRFGDPRRTEISDEEIGPIDMEDLIEEEMMVVSITSKGYIKRTPIHAYRAQRRGGKGLTGARTDEEDPIAHLFVASTHDYLMFFTNLGRVYWRKVYDLPQLPRDSRGRAIVNLLNLAEGEKVADCRAVRDFDRPDHYLIMATARGLVKKTDLAAYGRPTRAGIIAIKLRPGDELVDVVVAGPDDEIVLATAKGMAIRFKHTDVRPMGRAATGVKGISLAPDDQVVGMVVADPEGQLLTVCANGYGKRTPFGPNASDQPDLPSPDEEELYQEESLPDNQIRAQSPSVSEDALAEAEPAELPKAEAPSAGEAVQQEQEEAETDQEVSSARSYRTQRRGGRGLRDIKTVPRNGPVIGIVRVREEDEVMMITARGKIQRIPVADIPVRGRNTMGVRIMTLEEGDTLVAVKRIPAEANGNKESPSTSSPDSNSR
ncbi:MAG: DNA gyrase subunit A [Thermoguttaceae bacterium]|nr:DNA gyrase subunit A [Thermoguttaceae bacterium]MDW8039343.1 DNA gyrase subunit A [Thermoguttaceae bacterium]